MQQLPAKSAFVLTLVTLQSDRWVSVSAKIVIEMFSYFRFQFNPEGQKLARMLATSAI